MDKPTNPDPVDVQPGDLITTACGGLTRYALGVEFAYYKGKPVYFCMPACKQDYLRSPQASCLALTLSNYE